MVSIRDIAKNQDMLYQQYQGTSISQVMSHLIQV